MRVTKLNLQFFRNHKELKVEFPVDKDILVVQGVNGTGKTSILEALYYVSLLKSFRTNHNEDMVFWGEEYFRIDVEAQGETQSQKMEVFQGKPPHKKRVLKINEVERETDYFVGQLKTVLFTPRDLLILTDQPALRRTYLNRVLMQVESGFISLTSQYQRALKQRNALLKAYRKQVRDEELDVWDLELAKYGAPIVQARQNLVNFLNEILSEEYSKISGNEAKISLQYQSSAGNTEEFLQNLRQKRYQDMQDGVSNLGPHRDDLLIFMNERPVKNSLSQGELRSLALALKMAEGAYIQAKTNIQPVFLFDDVFSELDQGRQMRLIQMLGDCQVFITAAEEHCLGELIDQVGIIRL